ncbi:N-alpha-acetyltransferase 60 (Histone acetyltransferase type B protein 4) (HAT4) (N-acetyltransferase 15) (N-alpha-acetyltransferase F) (NatF) [Durusdinium trenchii]|uniref:N-alpha-acetyltransferase 60 n=1 Tax=Durusdinium trenchii TaxID=1381693 RepID=A0ABP0NV22_9DINO
MAKSSSSAWPDLSASTVPQLSAHVHRLSPPQRAAVSAQTVHFRALRAEEMDIEEMMALHEEWFPLSYDQDFYEKSVGGEFFSLVATWKTDQKRSEENILGMITISTGCEHHWDAIGHVLGVECETACQSAEETKHGVLAYILTLGVAEHFRRRGLAQELLRRSVEHVQEQLLEVQAIFLHVATYNKAAVQLYESLNFFRLEHFPAFYQIHGKYYDSYLYVLYLHEKPPWRVRLRRWVDSWSRGTNQWQLTLVGMDEPLKESGSHMDPPFERPGGSANLVLETSIGRIGAQGSRFLSLDGAAPYIPAGRRKARSASHALALLEDCQALSQRPLEPRHDSRLRWKHVEAWRRGSETSQRVVSLPPLLPRAQAARQASQAVVPRQPPPHPAGPSRELAPGQSSRKEGSEPLEGRARSAVPPARSAPRAPRAPGSRSAAARRNDAPVVGLDWSSAKAWHATEHLLQRLVGGASPQPPQACPHCRRKFQPQSLTRHANVCVHVFQKQRKAFDALRQRVPLELLTRVRRQKHRREVGRIPSQWRQRSKAFRTAIREARAASLSKVRPLRRNSAGDLDEKSPCPHCGRKFTEIHLAKHAPVCHLVPLVQRVAQTRPENIRAAGCAVGGAHDTRPW